MSVNGISSLSGFMISGQSGISEETRKKLIALGIDPSSVTSEVQAQMLIANALRQLEVQKTTNQSSSKCTCSSELELLTKAKNLAKQAEVSISPNQTLKEIIEKLTLEFQSFNPESKDSEKFLNELTSIKSGYDEIVQNQNSMYTAMNLTANLNKFMLGLK